MAKGLITQQHLEDIADAIRGRNNSLIEYKPSEMAEAVSAIPNSYAAADEGKVVKNGTLVSQTARATAITENGTYDTTENDEVTVNVSGGGEDLYPLWTDIYDNPMPTGVSVSQPSITVPLLCPPWVTSASQNVQSFVNSECRFGSRSYNSDNTTVQITKAIAQMSLDQFLHDESLFAGLVEYYGNLYNNALLTTYNMVLLGDFSQGGSTTGNALSDAITNYSAVALQGIYQKQRTSGYNTTIIYPLDLNTGRWTGMKDRNNSYSCNVTFTDASTVSLSGNKQVIIYGIP